MAHFLFTILKYSLLLIAKLLFYPIILSEHVTRFAFIRFFFN